MAAISFTADITRQNDMDTTASFGTIGGGPGASILSALRYQGTAAGARRVNSANTDFGFDVAEGTARDTTTAAFRNFGFKGFISQVGDLNANGLKLRLGSAGTAYHEWIMGDDGTIPTPGYQYPLTGGFIVKFVDATLRAWLNGTTGNPDETAIDEYGITANISATSNGENLALDALDWIENGFYMVGGDGADADGTFQDFVDEDEGEGSASFDRTGLWTSRAGVIFFVGNHSVGVTSAGTATATEFTDSFKTLVCPGDYVRQGFNALNFDITNASTVVDIANVNVTGSGRSGIKLLFDSGAAPNNGDVDTAADDIAYTAHGLITGEQVLYSQENGTGTVVSLTGGESELVTSTTGAYYYAIRVDADNFAVATSFANALAGTRAALSTATGIHSFTRTPDTRPDLVVTSDAAPGTFDWADSNLVSMRNITLGNEAELSGCQIVTCQKLTLGDGILTNCVINRPTVWAGEAFVDSTTVFASTTADGAISGCTFIAGDTGGHAIEFNTAGTYTFEDNIFTDYGPAATTFDSSSGSIVDLGNDDITITGHPYTDGDLVYYSDEGGTAITGLTDQDTYYVNSIDANTISLHTSRADAVGDTNRVNMTVLGTGTHAFYSANAAVYNSSGGLVTLSITGSGNAPSIRNSAGSTTSADVSVTLELNGLTEGSYGVFIGDGGAEDGNTLLSGYANSSGVISGSFGGTTPQNVIIRARNGGIINAAIQDDGGVFTDFTLAARTKNISGGTGTANDVDLLPSSPAVNDAFYFGGLNEFEEIDIDVDTAGSTYVIAWEYWNGSSWGSLSVTDNTNSFQTAGWNIVTFTAPSNWSTTTVNGQGPFFYVRARVTTGGGTQPRAQSITLNETIKYVPFNSTGTIQSGSGLTATAVWQEDTNNP